MNVCECVTINANLFPDRNALIFQGRKITYRELNGWSISAAEILAAKGVSAGDRVAIQVGNCPAFPIWYYATLRLGAIAVSLSTRLSESETQYVVDHSGSKVLVVDQSVDDRSSLADECLRVSTEGHIIDGPSLAATKENVSWHDANPNDPALILYTSGTTGFPKGATLTHGNVRSNVAAFNHLCQMKTEDRVLLAVPLFHCFGQNALLNSVLNVGATLILQERFDLNESKKLIQENQVTQLYGVPMMFQLLLDYCSPDELGSVNYCFSAAAPLAIQTSQSWIEKFGLPIHEGYGLTETSPFASYNHRNRFVAGSIGMPIDSVEMKVIDPESGKDCETGQLGELAIRGPNVMLGYWNQPEETANAIRDGWFLSGDIGRKDESGYYYIVDRVKDMIAVGGMKVFPAEVERVLRDHESVQDAAVVGIEESVMGEQVIGFVVVDKSSPKAADEIQQDSKRELAGYKVPRRIFEIDELPRNPSGKILKTKLREIAKEKLTATESVSPIAEHLNGSSADSNPLEASADPIQAVLDPNLMTRLGRVHPASKKETIAIALSELVMHLTGNEENPDHDQTFLELGMDSLMLVELGAQLQLELKSTEPLPATLIFDFPRIDDLAGYLLEFVSKEQPQSSVRESKMDLPSSANVASSLDEVTGPNGGNLVEEIQGLSEEEALEQLMKELE